VGSELVQQLGTFLALGGADASSIHLWRRRDVLVDGSWLPTSGAHPADQRAGANSRTSQAGGSLTGQ